VNLRDLDIEELIAAQKTIAARTERLRADGCPEDEIYQRLIASAPLVEDEPLADTCLRFAVLPDSPLPRHRFAEHVIQEAVATYHAALGRHVLGNADERAATLTPLTDQIAGALREARMLNEFITLADVEQEQR
jgi:hypothetical protein